VEAKPPDRRDALLLQGADLVDEGIRQPFAGIELCPPGIIHRGRRPERVVAEAELPLPAQRDAESFFFGCFETIS
jgi:hypothetical protein